MGALVKSRKSSREISDAVPQIAAAIKGQSQIARYVGKDALAAQVEKVYNEMTGEKFPATTKTARAARLLHRHSHALEGLAV